MGSAHLRKWVPLLLLGVLLLLPASAVLAQSGGGYDLSWWTAEGGGYTWSTGDGYSLGGTVGQADAHTQALTGGGYTLVGGFWPGAAAQYTVYLPLILRSHP